MPSKIITSDRDRSRIIDAYENGEDFVSLALSLDIKRTTAYEIIRTKQRTGQTNAVRGKGGRSSVIDNETIDLIVLLIEANPLITLRSMVAEVREVWPEKTHFSTTTVARVLEGELYSVKAGTHYGFSHEICSRKMRRVVFVVHVVYVQEM